MTGRKPALSRAKCFRPRHDPHALVLFLFQGITPDSSGRRTGPRIRAAGPLFAARRMRGSGYGLEARMPGTGRRRRRSPRRIEELRAYGESSFWCRDGSDARAAVFRDHRTGIYGRDADPHPRASVRSATLHRGQDGTIKSKACRQPHGIQRPFSSLRDQIEMR